MVIREFSHYAAHYVVLIVIEAILLGVYVATSMPWLRLLVSIATGLSYILWGMYTHRDEPSTTRLVLEYVTVGVLASLMLASLAYTT